MKEKSQQLSHIKCVINYTLINTFVYAHNCTGLFVLFFSLYQILLKVLPRASLGRAIAQAVSRWLPIAAVRVQTRVWSSGICGGQSVAGAGFLQVLRFPLPIFIPLNSPSS
jgi:hypothetical protein